MSVGNGTDRLSSGLGSQYTKSRLIIGELDKIYATCLYLLLGSPLKITSEVTRVDLKAASDYFLRTMFTCMGYFFF